MATLTYFVAVPFLRLEDGFAAGQAVELPSANAAIGRARTLSAQPQHAGAVAFSRTGDPSIGEFQDGVVLAKFGDVPEDLSEL